MKPSGTSAILRDALPGYASAFAFSGAFRPSASCDSGIEPSASTVSSARVTRQGIRNAELSVQGAQSFMANVSKQKRFSRIFERDGGHCWYCGLDLTSFERGSDCVQVDHVLPKSKGGTNADSNLVLSCRDCNYGKKTKTLEEFRSYFRRKHSAYARAHDLMLAAEAEADLPSELQTKFSDILSWLDSQTPPAVFYGERAHG